MDFKQRVLQRLINDSGEGADWLFDKLDRPGRATRAGIGALQEGQGFGDAYSAAKAQFGAEPPEAPTGADIADRVAEDYNIENPALLAGIATAADVVDPTMVIPGGQISKASKLNVLRKMAGKSPKMGKGVVMRPSAADKAADLAAAGKSKTSVVPTKQQIREEAARGGTQREMLDKVAQEQQQREALQGLTPEERQIVMDAVGNANFPRY